MSAKLHTISTHTAAGIIRSPGAGIGAGRLLWINGLWNGIVNFWGLEGMKWRRGRSSQWTINNVRPTVTLLSSWWRGRGRSAKGWAKTGSGRKHKDERRAVNGDNDSDYSEVSEGGDSGGGFSGLRRVGSEWLTLSFYGVGEEEMEQTD